MIDRFMTAQEIADAAKRLNLTCMPHTKRSVNRRAVQNGWNEVDQFARQRIGAAGGGGREYHVSLLPDVMQAALAAEISKEVTLRNTSELRDVEVAKREALDTTVLSARQRSVMDARNSVLTAVENVQVAEGRTRSQTVDLFLEAPERFEIDTATLCTANDRKNGSTSISRRTLLRWFQFRDNAGIGALAPKPTKQNAEIPAWFWDFLKFYARPQKPCITDALDDFLAEVTGVNEAITYDRVRRLIGKLGNVERHRGREGSLTLKARMAYVTRSTGDLLPTCVYTADGKTFDAEVANPLHGRPFRPEITSVLDVATRRCVGFSIGLAENAVGVVDALRHACEQYGIPAIFYVDRGSGFKNGVLDDRITGLTGRLGITKHHSLPQNSQARGIIERFQGSVWNKLSREFDTYVGQPMDRQARQKSFKVTRREVKEFGSSKSLMTWDEFLENCQRAIRAYNAAPHAALPNRMSPDEYWQSHVNKGFEPVTVTKAESDDLFRPYERRKVQRCLITFNTNKYFHIGLQEFDGDWVLVGYDIHDATRIWVRIIDVVDGEEKPGRLICIAKFGGNEQRYIPHTMERAAMEKRAAAAEKRLAEKLDAVHEELKPAIQIEHSASVPMPDLGADREPVTLEGSCTRIGEGSDISEIRAVNSAPRFGSDVELARWAVENADALHTSQRDILRECLNDSTDRQILLDHGIDVAALARILRHAA